MERKISLVKRGKFAVIGLFVLFSILSVMLIGAVKINYNISDYLDDSTDTKISLGIMEEEFGLISNVQVMVKDVTVTEAEEIKDSIKAIENVIFVNFNSQNTDYYKDDDALFVVLVDGNEYSETAKGALEKIETTLGEKYGDRLELGGTVMEKKLLRAAIVGEIFLILGISVALVAILMLITAASWIEPLVLLASSGIAVLLNMGTNLIFGEISYITNAVAAILQLAAATPNFLIHEIMINDSSFRKSITTEEVVFDDGYILIGDKPGLGIDVNVEEVEKRPYKPINLRHYTGNLTQIRPKNDTVFYFKGIGEEK